ncbi:porin family protein [Chryseobacterium sp. G0201]|uniref:porin family protein n=1 Tax=Chryseobacterium sp. G0201 TaxID=2487065 RepID=UPI000F4DB76E|nr:porin family protein [Chryseobacterium sp. G0201]AZA54890.1 PorT family protein [Chryseobacterium sp. G0201]
MKKLILGLAITVSTIAFAQKTASKSPVTFGLKAGMNISSISKDGGLENQGSKIGFNAGAFANIPVAASFSIQPELLYSQYGDKYDQKVLGKTLSFGRHLDYIAIPVMVQYTALPNLYLEAGPEFGFLVSAKNKAKNESSNEVIAQSGNYKDQLSGFNLGLGIGAGYYFTPNIGVTARYVAGLTDIAKNKVSGTDAIKNNVFQVGLAYKF